MSDDEDSGRRGRTVATSKNGGKRRGGKKKKKSDKLYCICQTPYDNAKFYVGCDVCSNWFHGDCVGITDEMSKVLTDYVCEDCAGNTDKRYCLCRKPYDESQ